jgi:epoxyqueuosine reductase
LNEFIRQAACSLGLDTCRITVPEISTSDVRRFHDWLSSGYAGEMSYMNRNVFLRTHPETLAEGIKSVVCVAMPYASFPLKNSSRYVISRYAYGKDYHEVLKEKLYQLLSLIKERDPEVSGRVCVDSVPVPEHALAGNAGLGWIGKNSLLIVPGMGSYVFLGELFLTLELNPDKPVPSRCGSCTRCMEACPVGAIVAPYTLDARKCLAYRTIEYRGDFAPEESLHNRVFGCDLCQEVCPWNQKNHASVHEEFQPSEELAAMSDEDWESLTESRFKECFAASAVMRAGYKGLVRNIKKIGEDSGSPR